MAENGFGEWKNHILKELERQGEMQEKANDLLHKYIEKNSEEHAEIKGGLETQNTKIKIWSSILAMVVASAVTMAFRFIG